MTKCVEHIRIDAIEAPFSSGPSAKHMSEVSSADALLSCARLLSPTALSKVYREGQNKAVRKRSLTIYK